MIKVLIANKPPPPKKKKKKNFQGLNRIQTDSLCFSAALLSPIALL